MATVLYQHESPPCEQTGCTGAVCPITDDRFAQHGFKLFLEAFCPLVSLQVVGTSPNWLDSEEPVDFSKQLGHETAALVSECFAGRTHSREYVRTCICKNSSAMCLVPIVCKGTASGLHSRLQGQSAFNSSSFARVLQYSSLFSEMAQT